MNSTDFNKFCYDNHIKTTTAILSVNQGFPTYIIECKFNIGKNDLSIIIQFTTDREEKEGYDHVAEAYNKLKHDYFVVDVDNIVNENKNNKPRTRK